MDELIKKYGGKINYDALAKKHGGKIDVKKILKKNRASIDTFDLDERLAKLEKIKVRDGKDAKEVDVSKLKKEILKELPVLESKEIIREVESPDLPVAFKRLRLVEEGMKDVFKRLSFQSSSQTTSFGGEVTKLSLLTDDVKITNPTNGQALVFNSTDNKWENSSAGTNQAQVLRLVSLRV